MSEENIQINISELIREFLSYGKFFFISILIGFIVSEYFFSNKINEDRHEIVLSSQKMLVFKNKEVYLDKVNFVTIFKTSLKNNFLYEKNLENYLEKKNDETKLSYFYNFKKISLKNYLMKNKIETILMDLPARNLTNINISAENFTNLDKNSHVISIKMKYPAKLNYNEFIVDYLKYIHEITHKSLINNLKDYFKENIQMIESISSSSTILNDKHLTIQLALDNLLKIENEFNNLNFKEFYDMKLNVQKFNYKSFILKKIFLTIIFCMLSFFLLIYLKLNFKIKS